MDSVTMTRTQLVAELKAAFESGYFSGAGDDAFYAQTDNNGNARDGTHCAQAWTEYASEAGYED